MTLVARFALPLYLMLLMFHHAMAADDTLVVATFDGGAISQDDLTQYRSALESSSANIASTDTPESVLEDLVLNRLIGLEARALGLDQDPKISAELDEMLSFAYLRARVSMEDLRPSAAAIADHYAAHREEFRKPLRLRVAHVLIASHEEAVEIHEAIVAGGDFAEFAREHSQDSASAPNGGDLGWLRADELPDTLMQAALGLKPEQVSTPVKTRFGYHLVKAIAIGPVEYRPLDDALKRELSEQIIDRKYRAMVDEVKHAAWAKHAVFIDRQAIKKIAGTRNTAAEAQATEKTAAANLEHESIATIGEERFTVGDLRLLEPAMLSFLGQGLEAEQIEGTLEHHVMSRVLAKEARAQKLDELPLVRTALDSVLGTAYMQARFPRESLKATDDELEAYYEAHKDDYRLPRRVHLAHILLASEEDASAVLAMLRQGAEFAALARARSLDPATAWRGGYLDAQTVIQLYRPLADTALKLAPGKAGGPVASPFGYHVVKLVERAPIEYRPQTSLVGQLRQLVVNQKKANLTSELKQGLWKKYRVAIDPAVLPVRFVGTTAVANDQPSAMATTALRIPRLQLISRVYHLPPQFDPDTRHRILVANTGNADLTIDGLSSRCACLRAGTEGKVRLASGETGELEFLIDPRQLEQDGRSIIALVIDTNDPAAQRFTVRINVSKPQTEGSRENT